MISLAETLKLLGDETRLRILHLLGCESLNVSELTSILGLAQSGISRQLGLLRNAGLVEEQREGGWSFYRIEPSLQAQDGNGAQPDAVGQAWRFVRQRLEGIPGLRDDTSRLREVLRRRENLGNGLNERLLEPGQSWFAWVKMLHGLLPPRDVIDLGCGDGTLTVELATFGKRVLGIDQSPSLLASARAKTARQRAANLTFLNAAMEALPVVPQSFDLALISQALHHLPAPGRGIAEAVRVLRPGGSLLILELMPHRNQWVREKLGHIHLGFSPKQLKDLLSQHQLRNIACQPVVQSRGEPFRVLLAQGQKPG